MSASAWHVWTDGSAVCDERYTVKRGGKQYFPGGWAAIVEHGSDGFVLRGRERDTTNVRMEIVAVIEGLRAVPTGETATLHFDCTVVLSIRERWMRDEGWAGPNDGDLWKELGEQFDRVNVIFDLLTGPHPIHSRAHGFAGAEAKAQAQDMPPNAVPLSMTRGERRRNRRAGVLAEKLLRNELREVSASPVEEAKIRDAFEAAGFDAVALRIFRR